MEQINQNTALLVMDMQDGILKDHPATNVLVENVVKAICSAREHELLVIYITAGYRPGGPELSGNNKSSVRTKARINGLDMAEFMKIPEAIVPEPNDVIITKRRVSAFSGTELEIILRAQQVQHIVLTGLATSGVVLSTLREAADKDYKITVLADCCWDPDEEVHQVLNNKVFPRQADVLNLEEWIKAQN